MNAIALAKRAFANPTEAFRVTEHGATVGYANGYFYAEQEVFYSRSGLTPTDGAVDAFEVADDANAYLLMAQA